MTPSNIAITIASSLFLSISGWVLATTNSNSKALVAVETKQENYSKDLGEIKRDVRDIKDILMKRK